MRLQDIMQTNVRTVSPTDTAVFANETMWRYQIHHLAVVEGDELVGVISDTDLGGEQTKDVPDGLLVRDAMTPSVVTADPNTTIDRATNIFRERNLHCLPVLENGKLVGIITSTDIDNLARRGRGDSPTKGAESGVGYPPLQSQQQGTTGKGEHEHRK